MHSILTDILTKISLNSRMIIDYSWKILHRIKRLITPVFNFGGPRFEYQTKFRHPYDVLIVPLGLSVKALDFALK
jgi:hypothetical protein